ncbi:hypothetical protein NQ318_017498 [Aromia moschata]|uniref:Mos1 transposase HTH domain-containing protein n=1 Tax=Aromia moschata TaxID=1265417 RepID=A0AAV8XQP0_9CUCU|nr:hypothetical protein NQ318_017498 [Aromia moschata]
MLSVKREQRVNLKFLVKLGKTLTEAYAMLKEVYGNEGLSRSQVFEWFKRFKEGRETTEDDPRPGRPSTSQTDENIEKNFVRNSNVWKRIVDETGQLEPIVVGVVFSYPLRRLEGVHYVGDVHVRVALVDQLVEFLQSFTHVCRILTNPLWIEKDGVFGLEWTWNVTTFGLLDNPKDKIDNNEKSGIYEISCKDCDQKCIGQTQRSILTRFKEHTAHLKYGRTEKSCVAQHDFDNNHRIDKNNLKLIRNVTNSRQLGCF